MSIAQSAYSGHTHLSFDKPTGRSWNAERFCLHGLVLSNIKFCHFFIFNIWLSCPLPVEPGKVILFGFFNTQYTPEPLAPIILQNTSMLLLPL